MGTFKSELVSAMKHVDSMTLDDCNDALNLLNFCIEEVQRARIKLEQYSFTKQSNDLQLVKSPDNNASDTFADFETSENDNTYSTVMSKSKRKEKHFSSVSLNNKIRKRKSGKKHKKANLTKTVIKLLDKFSLNETCQKTKPTNFCCVICGENFVDHLLLYDHLANHEGAKISCNLCKKIFENMLIFKYHMDDKKCTFIRTGIKGEAFRKPSSEDCLQIMKFRYCPFCGESFTTRFNLKRHIASRKCCPKIINALHCIHCKLLTFQSPDEVAEHMKIHTHPCAGCNLTLPTIRALKKHRVAECLGSTKDKKPHVCKDCSEVFLTRKTLRTHMTLHPKPKKAKAKHKCDECNYSSHNTWRVKRHKRTVHTSDAEGRTLVCDQCPSMFKDLKTLKDHIIYLHTDKFSYICNICGKCYKMKSLLTRHMLLHLNKRRHNCLLCPQKFFRSTHLERHLISKHKKETPVNKKSATLPSIPVETTTISNINLNAPMEQSQANLTQMLSLIDMQSGEIVTMSAVDYIYGLVVKNHLANKNKNVPLNTAPELPAMWNQIDVYSVADQAASTSHCSFIQMPNIGHEGLKDFSVQPLRK